MYSRGLLNNANSTLNRDEQRKEWLQFFEEVDREQYLKESDIPLDTWIPQSKEDVVSYMKMIGKPQTEEEKIEGKQ